MTNESERADQITPKWLREVGFETRDVDQYYRHCPRNAKEVVVIFEDDDTVTALIEAEFGSLYVEEIDRS